MRIWLNGKKQSVIGSLIKEGQSEKEQKTVIENAELKIQDIVKKIVSKARFLKAFAQPLSFKS